MVREGGAQGWQAVRYGVGGVGLVVDARGSGGCGEVREIGLAESVEGEGAWVRR
jgi:hypothetical protein